MSRYNEFTKDDKRDAIRAFSGCHNSLLIFLVVANLVAVAVSVLIPVFLGEEKAIAIIESPYFLWGTQILSMYVIGFPVFLIATRNVPRMEIDKSELSFKEFFNIFLVAESCMLLGSLISQAVASMFNVSFKINILSSISDVIIGSPLWLVILVVVIIGPIVEEVIFRKVFIDCLSVYGYRVAILVSSIAFGLFHGNLDQLFYATMIGFVLGYVYCKTGRLIYTCLLHMIVNFFGSVPAMLLADKVEELNSQLLDPAFDGVISDDLMVVVGVLLLQYLFMILGIGVFVVATFKRSYSLPKECEIRIPFFKRPRILLFNMGTLLFLAYSVLTILLTMTV